MDNNAIIYLNYQILAKWEGDLMRKKLIVSSMLAGVLAVGIGFGGHTYASETTQVLLTAEQSEQIEIASDLIIAMHEGEKPISTSVDENTGVTVEIYEVNESPFQTFASGWQTIGSDSFVLYNDNKFRTNGTIAKSGGGDFGIRVSAHTSSSITGSAPLMTFQLMEDDPSGDQFVGQASFSNKSGSSYDVVFRSIGSYVDGTDGKAEFYVKHAENYKLNSGSLRVTYID